MSAVAFMIVYQPFMVFLINDKPQCSFSYTLRLYENTVFIPC